MMIDLHPLALAYLRAQVSWRTGVGTDDAVETAGDDWEAADCPIEIPPPDRAGFVRVRVVVAVLDDGSCRVFNVEVPENNVRRIYPTARITFIEAWVPKPAAPETVEGEVAGE